MKSQKKYLICSLLAMMILCSTGGALVAQTPAWSYHYLDEFDTDKAERDSYSHSVFWPEGAFPPAEPYLYYSTSQGDTPRSLVFASYQGVPAHLNYCFPLNSLTDEYQAGQIVRSVSGTIEFDLQYPPTSDVPDPPPGYLLYSLSPDGQDWTVPAPLEPGHHSIAVSSDQGTCYIAFLGSDMFIDNLEVYLNAPSATIHVPEDYDTIQEAIDNALDGDIIEVAPGTYSGPGNWDIELRGKAVTVRSSGGPGVTTIDCHDSSNEPGSRTHRGFYIHENEGRHSIIRGFTIRNGIVPGSEIPADDMRWNLSPDHPIGGGIYCEFSSPSIVNCVIRDCGTEIGGGIGCVGGAPKIVHCLITKCRAGGFGPCESGGFGGGIGMIRHCTAPIGLCRITDNLGYWNSKGGGLYCRNSSARVFGCEISDNRAQGNIKGGGVYCSGYFTEVHLQNCIIRNNTSYHTGGGIYAEHGSGYPQCDDGNCPPCNDDGSCPPCRITVANCTIANNNLADTMPPLAGGGIYSNHCDIRVKNCIAWYNTGSQIQIIDPYSNSPVTYCDVQGGYPGAGNIYSDPLFASTGMPDYHLLSLFGRFDPNTGDWVIDNSHSPCIDTGDPDDSVGMEPFPNGKRINMGAYGGTSQASMGHGSLVYHVDTIHGDDTNNGLSRATAFQTIQKGINSTKDSDAVVVWPGVYNESIAFLGKAITVQSAADAAVIEGADDHAVHFNFFEGSGSVLKNFVIANSDVGILLTRGSCPTIRNVTVVGNRSGVEAYENSKPDISNGIFWFNTEGDLFQCNARYSCIQELDGAVNNGNISEYPRFADPADGDYHLLSERGRFMPFDLNEPDGTNAREGLWVLDNVTSPCIDMADPSVSPKRERMPNGGRVNMGAYGGAAYASMSEWPLLGDFNYDGIVNLRDFARFAENWLARLNQWPQVKIVSPQNGEIIPWAIETIIVEAKAWDSDGFIVRVAFYLDGSEVPFEVDTNGNNGWSAITSPPEPGVHKYQAKATDNEGATTASLPVRFIVVDE